MKKICLLLTILISTPTFAAIKTQTITYKQGDTVLEGFLAYDTAGAKKKPGVLVIHEWTGLGDYVKERAKKLAKLGYVAFAADIYGKGVRPNNPKDAGATAGVYKNDRALMRARVAAALEQLTKNNRVNSAKIAAIGYCFGGTTALELARSGANILGAVSFHGGLETSMPAEKSAIKGRVLVLHGADDPYVPAEEVAKFEEEMRSAAADWELVKYSGAVHSFTNPEAGNDPKKGAAYNANADQRSWIAMKEFFRQIF